MRHDQDDPVDRGVGTSVNNKQEDRDCGILRVASKKGVDDSSASVESLILHGKRSLTNKTI